MNVVETIPGADDTALREILARESVFYGAENLLLGDAFDADAGRPLRHKPGFGLYATGEGVRRRERFQKRARAWDEASTRRQPPVMKLRDGTVVPLRSDERADVQSSRISDWSL